MLRRILIGAVIAAAVVSPAATQDDRDQNKPGPAAPQPTPQASQNTTRPSEPSGQPLNVRMELTITDQVGTAEPYKKVVTLIVADRQRGFVRSRGDLRTGDNRWRTLSINVDARPQMIRDTSLVRLELGLEYQPQPIVGAGATNVAEPGSWVMNEQVGVVLESGKPLVVSQAFDPTSDRRISVELKATILK
jgi:hypothetical protein